MGIGSKTLYDGGVNDNAMKITVLEACGVLKHFIANQFF
jgi:hypothetical protein